MTATPISAFDQSTPLKDAVLDVLAPVINGVRCPIFEWPHETTPTDQEMAALAGEIQRAMLALIESDGCLGTP